MGIRGAFLPARLAWRHQSGMAPCRGRDMIKRVAACSAAATQSAWTRGSVVGAQRALGASSGRLRAAAAWARTARAAYAPGA
jgi:hypothetical protein